MREDKEKSAARSRRTWGLILLSLAAVVIAGYALFTSFVKAPNPHLQTSATPAQSSDVSGQDGAYQPPDEPGGYKEDFYTILLFGTDEDDYNADVIMVASFDKKNGKVEVVSLPRDTMINVSRNNKKLNASYGVGKSGSGDTEDGAQNLLDAVSTLIGFRPDYYCMVQFEGFKDVVDALGGVKFDVPQRMKKSAPHIDLEAGEQVLSGEQALGLVRFRDYPTGDLKRIEVAQSFLKATARQMIKLSNVPKIPQIVSIISESLESNLITGEMVWFGMEIMSLDSEEDIAFHTMPVAGMGKYGSQDYVYADRDALIALVNQTVNPYKREITADDADIIRLEN